MRLIGGFINKLFGSKVAYYCKYPLDKKAMKRELEKGLKQESGKKQMQKASKIAILFIGTSRYVEFFPKTNKEFFVFTDVIEFPYLKNKKDVSIVKIEHQKWPYSTLMRFKIINKIAKKLNKYSHIIFIDADMFVNKLVTEEEFFSHNKPLFGVKHDSYVNKPGEFEFNTKSTAALKPGDDLSNYVVGAFWGGRKKEMINLLKELEKRVDVDLKNNVIAKWHDESQLNKYLIERKNSVHILDPSYAYPEFKPIPPPYKKRIIHLLQSPIKKSTPGKNKVN